ncbi:hypothetical protein, partial [Stenotrophomonas maltophilia]|uniref:hypothetical protein n=1 Tax=Stenotrophomonas maltophilia TaxID=40324 RepID=UPI0013DC6AA3
VLSPAAASRAFAATRRAFLAGAGGALIVAALLGQDEAAAAEACPFSNVKANPNAFIKIGADNTVTVLVKHLDMGQGCA